VHLSETRMRQGLAILGVVQLVIGAWLAIDPDSFVDKVAPFGTIDDHFLRDIATFQLATGVALLMAVGRPAWRVPVLFFAVVQGVLHTINHLIDVGDTDPSWQGPFNFVSLLIQTALFAYLLREAAAEEKPPS
jgi:uncharacterized membrane protein